MRILVLTLMMSFLSHSAFGAAASVLPVFSEIIIRPETDIPAGSVAYVCRECFKGYSIKTDGRSSDFACFYSEKETRCET